MSSSFPETMTTETTVSKGQEFFSTGHRQRGMHGGDINWERCCVTVVVDTTKMENMLCMDKEFLHFDVKDFRKWTKFFSIQSHHKEPIS